MCLQLFVVKRGIRIRVPAAFCGYVSEKQLLWYRSAHKVCRKPGTRPRLETMRILLFFFFLLTIFSAAAQTTPVMTLHDLSDAETLGADLYTNSGATGLVLVVVRGDQTFFHGYGQAVPGSHEAPTRESVVRLCSLTKIFTADLLAKMVADGSVRLDDPLAKYAPAGNVVPVQGTAITLEELATHTAGLEREIGTAPRKTPHFTYPDFETRWHWLASAQLKSAPGTKAFYSNIGFDLLSDALEKAAKKPYAALLDARTLSPLKMWDTTFYPSPRLCEKLMTGAHDEGPCTITAQTEGSSGLYSTPADMERFLRYLVGESASVEKQSGSALGVYLLPESLKGQYGLDHAGRPTGIGLGWMHLADGSVSQIIQKTGGGAGFVTYIAIHPASKTALFVAMTEGRPRAWRPGFNLFKASNDGLLALAGLPPLPDTRRRLARRHVVRTAQRVRAKRRGVRKRGSSVAQRAVGGG